MSYTPPAGNALAFSWQGRSAYTPPAGNALSFSWVSSVSAAGGATLLLTAGGTAAHGVAASGGGALELFAAGAAETGFTAVEGAGGATLSLFAGGVAAHGVAGFGGAQLVLQAGGAAGHGVAAVGAADLSLSGAGAGIVLRYEIRTAVRQSGVALARRVRAYRLSDGALLGEADTVAGKCRVPAGLVEGELCYLIPIDMSVGATDYRPVAANRVAAVLADDVAEIPA